MRFTDFDGECVNRLVMPADFRAVRPAWKNSLVRIEKSNLHVRGRSVLVRDREETDSITTFCYTNTMQSCQAK